MSEQASNGAGYVSANIQLGSGDWQLQAKVTIPAGPTRHDSLLPIIQSLASAVGQRTTQAVEAAGEQISCKAGCGACCRHLVAISEFEARRLHRFVNQLPEPSKAEVLGRFADALAQLDKAGLLQEVRKLRELNDDEYQSLAERYFLARVACPFLREESCSIHPERPITCREYLVTSDPIHCETPTPEKIRRVRVVLPMFNPLAWWESGPTKRMCERWVPLVLALEWTEANPVEPPPAPGPELLQRFLKSAAAVAEGIDPDVPADASF